MSLKARLGWLIAIVLTAMLAVNVAIMIGHAGPRVRAEAESIEHLSHELVETALASVQETKDPIPSLRRLFDSLRNLRHIEIEILPNDDTAPNFDSQLRSEIKNGVPDWFVSLVAPAPKVDIIPARIGDVQYGNIAIIFNPVDELAEIWSDLLWLGAISLAVTLLMLALVLALLRRTLAPFDSLGRGLARLEAGETAVRLDLRGASEFRDISQKLNSLASTLDRVQEENHSLIERLFAVQDSERRDIARDLHDEAGPCLFSIRAGAATLAAAASGNFPDRDLLQRSCANIDAAGQALQTLLRRMLERLRPPAMSELGLETALRGLVASWSDGRADVRLSLRIAHDLSCLDERSALTAYRVVQEALTNIFRHSSAANAEARLEFVEAPPELAGAAEALRVVVEDDGVGLPEEHRFGLGLIGMSERVHTLGGVMRMERRPEGGTRIEVLLPLPEVEELPEAEEREGDDL
ncbi:HAMP domain-containing protein [Methylosinus sporium]|uniref:Oxygen sensor histidine kinase NreB n=1 Tax=Methylosinus sporium TaxID=428 RepID=A0A549SNQ5_METSR|nr:MULTISPECIES: ATP-binding protein [Methylosinus]MBU3888311.1 HAMP domain-containing protein [Methylosinus sp. KRF6]TRL31254.1 HAMP domain-containing protein [Methylosinus sporium]